MLAHHERSAPLSVSNFRLFSMVIHLGFQKVTYVSEIHEISRVYFGISRNRARMIGKALTRDMQYFAITLTTTEEDAFSHLADAVPDGTTITEVCISHKSEDEVTVMEAKGIARLIAKLRSKRVHIWAGEYEVGALDAFRDELISLRSDNLREYDVCDITKPEPEDSIALPRLDEFLARYR